MPEGVMSLGSVNHVVTLSSVPAGNRVPSLRDEPCVVGAHHGFDDGEAVHEPADLVPAAQLARPHARHARVAGLAEGDDVRRIELAINDRPTRSSSDSESSKQPVATFGPTWTSTQLSKRRPSAGSPHGRRRRRTSLRRHRTRECRWWAVEPIESSRRCVVNRHADDRPPRVRRECCRPPPLLPPVARFSAERFSDIVTTLTHRRGLVGRPCVRIHHRTVVTARLPGEVSVDSWSLVTNCGSRSGRWEPIHRHAYQDVGDSDRRRTREPRPAHTVRTGGAVCARRPRPIGSAAARGAPGYTSDPTVADCSGRVRPRQLRAGGARVAADDLRHEARARRATTLG